MTDLSPRQSGRNNFAYVFDGRQTVGHIISRGPRGFEAYDRDDKSVGIFATAAAAANALIVGSGQ
jgi:hypothetical protein